MSPCLEHSRLGLVKTLLNHSNYPKYFVTAVSQFKIEFEFFNFSFLDLRTPYLQKDRNQEIQNDRKTDKKRERRNNKQVEREKE